jgi:Rrf2 family protein
MILSKSSKYAIRAMLYIAMQSKKSNKVGLNDIAGYLEIPKDYLGQLMHQLVKKRLVQSMKGPGGGFYLTNKEKSKNLLNVIEAIDGLEEFTECGLGIAECDPSNPCPIHDYIVKYRENMIKDFGNTTIDQIGEQIKQGELFIMR